ncbi:MAG: RNA polymerase factor sigma-54 [Bryobacteraceae bacterium]|nr:RNA polymerase factor sigma-54 [Bryobacteraceae bacterium]
MSPLAPRLSLRVAQKQILTPSLVQMVTMLQSTRLELKDMILAELAANPVLEESNEAGEDLTPEEIQILLEAERSPEPADAGVLEMTKSQTADPDTEPAAEIDSGGGATEPAPEAAAADPFDEIDYGSFFDDYLDPGYKTPAGENPERPGFETFAAAPVTLADHLERQLSLVVLTPEIRDAAQVIIGNLDANGYLTIGLEEVAELAGCSLETAEKALEEVQSLEPAGIGARDMRECLLLQLESRRSVGGVAWRMVEEHLPLVESRDWKTLAKAMGRPVEHIEIAFEVIRKLDPRPGEKYSTPGARHIEPDVYFIKEGNDYFVQLNDEEIPQVRLNPQYRRMIDKDQEPDKSVRNYIRERMTSAYQLIKNIEQRRQTILKVCQTILERQTDMLDRGLDFLRPMMIKDVAAEIGVHPSTVSRAVANKYAHTPQGVIELRTFFSEAVQGPSGGEMPLATLKRKVKKMIEDEDRAKPLTDDRIVELLKAEGIAVTRRTVAKYREDMNIPSTHQRRLKT